MTKLRQATGILLLTGLLLQPLQVYAQSNQTARQPLLIEGKKTLYQRVLTRPGAKLYKDASPTSAVIEESLSPFSVFYVFARKGLFVEVGPKEGPKGYIQADKVIDWKQTIVAAFNNPAGRQRSLLFKNQQVLDDLIRDPDVVQKMAQLRNEAAAGQVSPSSAYVAIEPQNFVSIDDKFYLMPILEHSERRMLNRLSGKVLHVAAVRKEDAPQAPQQEQRKFLIGIDFVIDTTMTMGPYIARVKAAVEKIQVDLARANLADRVRFGLIGFRQDTKISPKTEYHTRVFVPLDQNATSSVFLEKIKIMDVAKSPTPGWREDSLGGVYEAIRSTKWDQFGGRYVILISDAGPRLPEEKNTLSKMKPRELNGFAAEQRVAIFTMHLRTKEGENDRSSAEASYKELSSWNNAPPLYFGIENGSDVQFGSSVDKLVTLLVEQIKQVDGGQTAAPTSLTNDPLEQAAQQVGLAMQLAYLGQRNGNASPDVFDAWISDRDITDPRKAAIDVRVFLTKNQLANLRDITQAIIDEGEASIQNIDPAAFFQRLRSAVANMSRDPSRMLDRNFQNLGDALGEFLQDLPYQSEVIRINDQKWMQMSGAEQRELIDRLKSKLALYEQIHNTPMKWIALGPGTADGEKVSAIPLNFMP